MANGPKLVTLIDPNGGECSVSTPADINNLVFGQGYKVKGGKSADDAIASLSGQAADVAAAQSTETKTSK